MESKKMAKEREKAERRAAKERERLEIAERKRLRGGLYFSAQAPDIVPVMLRAVESG